MIKRILLTFLYFCSCFVLLSQEVIKAPNIISFTEFMAQVKQHHPVVKQADIVLSNGEAYLLKSRGGFDPKIEIDYATKDFKKIDYYDLLNATFKIPTWYGVEFKANFEQNSGEFLNLQNSVPEDGLFAAGVQVAVLEGLLINDRMAALKKAKFFKERAVAERDLLINEILFDAAQAYFEWVKANNELKIYTDFLDNSETRFQAIKRNVEVGENAAIDSTEAKITVQNRLLNIENSRLMLTKKRLKASNYLWINGIPVELEDHVIPDFPNTLTVENSDSVVEEFNTVFDINLHPKLMSMQYKAESLNIDRRLKFNKLLPKLSLGYNFITEDPFDNTSINTDNFKANAGFYTPLFLRKERGDLRLAKNKLLDLEYETAFAQVQIKNKINNQITAIESFENQTTLINDLVINYNKLVNAAERKLFVGESSVFAVNTYESKLIDAKLKQNSTEIKSLLSRVKLYKESALMAKFIL